MGPRIGRWTLAIACLLVIAGTGEAAPPPDVTYQGLLLDSVGDPLIGPVNIEIGVWDQPTGGTQFYGETHSGVALVDGVFSLLLGTGSVLVGSFDADLFATQNRYLEVIVNSEALTPRQPFSSVAYALQSGESDEAAYAVSAGDADTVDGSHAASLDQSAHVFDTGNPHGVTATQVGAVTSSQLASHAAEASAHHAKTTTLAELSGQAADAQIPAGITRDSELTAGLAGKADAGHLHDERYFTEDEVLILLGTLSDRITYLEGLLEDVTRVGNDITFSGVNVHVVNGDGATESKNGLGNLIVGYNENIYYATRTGSHNLIVGTNHEYTSYGGFVAGSRNTISGDFGSVSGGGNNTASGDRSSVSGGVNGEAGGSYGSVSGGHGNLAIGHYSSVSGGISNDASGYYSSVIGGRHNTASGDYSSVVGGGYTGGETDGNEAYADYSAVVGGYRNIAGDGVTPTVAQASSILGGRDNDTTGLGASVSGGSVNTASGDLSSVTGGYTNTAQGGGSSVSGGRHNLADNFDAAVSGGDGCTASGVASSVSGGNSNTASGDRSTVGGGSTRTASGNWDWVAGSLFENN